MPIPEPLIESSFKECFTMCPQYTQIHTHWVSLGTMFVVPTGYTAGTLWAHRQSNYIIPTWYTAGTFRIFLALFPKIFPEEKYLVHLRCSRWCDCNIQIGKFSGTLKMFPKGVLMVFSNRSIKVFLAVFQFPEHVAAVFYKFLQNLPNMVYPGKFDRTP